MMDYIEYWDPASAAPIMNIGYWNATDIYAGTLQMCLKAEPTSLLSFYTSKNVTTETLLAICDALQTCDNVSKRSLVIT